MNTAIETRRSEALGYLYEELVKAMPGSDEQKNIAKAISDMEGVINDSYKNELDYDRNVLKDEADTQIKKDALVEEKKDHRFHWGWAIAGGATAIGLEVINLMVFECNGGPSTNLRSTFKLVGDSLKNFKPGKR